MISFSFLFKLTATSAVSSSVTRLPLFVRAMSSNNSLLSLPSSENALMKYLKAEEGEMKRGDKVRPHEVRKSHFSHVLPEPVPDPELVIASPTCAESLGLNPTEFSNPFFAQLFSGNELIPGFDKPYCTVYGCHSYGQWFGQLGDGRAITIGELHNPQDPPNASFYTDGIRELQLKGSGRSPFSRGFDGKAVLRSSIREFLGK
jgi:uncharacterized protein YdiU (UPF0061 family)